MLPESACFIPFTSLPAAYTLPRKFTYPFRYQPHPLSLLAVAELQKYLKTDLAWEHNFGLNATETGKIIGKMFGVLVVQNAQNELGYLAAFSGKIAGSFHHAHFVPPVFDSLEEGSFLNLGMQALTELGKKIKALEEQKTEENSSQLSELYQTRKEASVALQGKLFDQFYFLNQMGETKSIRHIFQKQTNNNPPAGAGECAAPKLLQYAFQHNLKPVALAEFWWGQSPKTATWKHGHFYPACREKCEPILGHMLEGMQVDAAPVS
ncbi:pseudouridylate synthase [Pontibacter arcticus]|uniref:Pseudouridylate synthase n=1 Tax=Pontibacter arcticus TaxID=2080288 RepID=A0A364RD12_9BACT|nr:pseudouridylate synthase [Pontibacter arcticus]